MHFLKSAWNRWKTIAHHVGVFQSRLILTLFYFILILPIGLIFTLAKDELGLKDRKISTWRKKEKQAETVEELKEQY